MFTLCFVASCYVFCFEFHFLIHLAPLMHHSPYSFLHLLSSFLLDSFVYSCQKGGEYTLECIPESFVISIWFLCTSLRGEVLFLVHICRGRDIPYGRCIYQGEEDIVLIRKLCFGVWCMIKLLTCFTSCLLDHNLLVTLYLSFYVLLYLEGLMCFVQVFQVTGIYVPSASQLLIILKGRNFKHF